MPRIIFIAATKMEADCLSESIRSKYPVIISGMGVINAAIATIHALQSHSAELVVGFGIAGAIDRGLRIGQVVQITSDYEADLGAYRETPSPHFVSFNSPVYCSSYTLDGLDEVRSRTVSTACTPLVSDNGDQLESMEGAAVMAAAKSCGAKYLQIRAISNYVDQPRGEWKIEEALEALGVELSKYF